MSSKYVVNENPKINDEDWLREQYIENRMSANEIAKQIDYSKSTVESRLDEYGIERRDVGRASHEKDKHWDKEWLYEKYHGDGLSLKEIADECNVGHKAIRRMMIKYDIERRKPLSEKYPHSVPMYVDGTGHPTWSHTYKQKTTVIGVHRLVAIADGVSPYEVFSENNVIHHKNHIPWDNRPENLELMNSTEHIIHHGRDNHK